MNLGTCAGIVMNPDFMVGLSKTLAKKEIATLRHPGFHDEKNVSAPIGPIMGRTSIN